MLPASEIKVSATSSSDKAPRKLRFLSKPHQITDTPAATAKTSQMDQALFQQILDISRRMAETRNLEPLLNYVIEEAIKLVGAERGYIVLVQPDGLVEIRVKCGEDGEQLQGEEDHISQSVFSQAVETGKPLILRDAVNDPNFGDALSVVTLQLRSIMCVPFISRGETVGAIYVENRSIKNRFKEDDLPPLILFANQAAVAIENAALNDELEARVKARTQQLEQSWSEVVEANRLRTEWLSNVAHDLRAPLGITSMSLSYLRQEGFGPLNEEQHEWVEKSMQAVEHTSCLIDDLFDLFKLEAGGVSLRWELITLKDFLHNVHDVALGLPREKVDLNLDIPDDLPHLFMDLIRVRQVLLNLLTNAFKFTTKGNVTIYACYQPNDKEVLIGVRDTGTGIPKDKIECLFERFQQVDKGDRRGSGLGLAISRELVELHGGRIWVESTPGVGSNFMFTLLLNPPS